MTRFTLFLFSLRFLLMLVTACFVVQPFWLFSFLQWFPSNDFFYGTLGILGVLAAWIPWLHTHKSWYVFRSLLISFLPVVLIIGSGHFIAREFHYLIDLSLGVYAILAFAYWATDFIRREQILPGTPLPTKILAPVSWHEPEHRRAIILVLLLTGVFFALAFQNLGRYAAVDEPLWLDGRIGKFWKHLSAQSMEKTLISDKPGITIVWVTGPALLVVDPSHYRDTRHEYQAKNPALKIEHFYLAFRLPLLFGITCLLPFFFLLLSHLIGTRMALISYAGITLSPVLIGMSKIVNPDSLLWIFTPLSLLAYLVFLEKKTWRFLILSGILLGLALLTKYVANFLIVFLFGLIFLYPIWNGHTTPRQLRQALLTFLLWVGVGISVLYLAVPAFWVQPERLIESTLLSQAFEKVAWLFLGIILLILFDQFFFKCRLSLRIITLLERSGRTITVLIVSSFSLCFAFVFINGITSMPWVNFTEFLTSPKSISQFHNLVAVFLTHGYPLLFGTTPLIVIGSMLALHKTWVTNPLQSASVRLVLVILVFILLYYVGSTVNEVVLINRYQITLYPLVAILGGMGLSWGITSILKRVQPALNTPTIWYSAFLFVCLILALSPFRTPFPLSYASSLLPKEYAVDVKDMGAGSYEAAAYLNQLPNAATTAIWTDKSGVCKFYIGPCVDGFTFRRLTENHVKYIVISSGRASRVERRFIPNPAVVDESNHPLQLDSYYRRDDALQTIYINDRTGQTVKIFGVNF